MFSRNLALLVCASIVSMSAHGATVIDSRAYFENIEHTLIDFETRGDGSPVIITQPLGGLIIPANEYEAQGFLFDERLGVWQEMRGPTCDLLGCSEGDALLKIGSPSTALSGGPNGRGIVFTQEVHAFSIGVVQSFWATYPATQEAAPTVIAFDAMGSEIGRVSLWGELIDGGYGEWDGVVPLIAYGEIGLASATPIARLEITVTGQSAFDDLRFSSVPAPGAMVVMGVGIALISRRSR